jgi:chromate transporter
MPDADNSPTATTGPTGSDPAPRRARLLDVAWVFLKIGTVSFGGPAGHVAMMEDEVVRRRAWVSREEFLDLNSATNFIPGPNSTELAIHLGFRRAGWAGIWVGGACFIAPAVVIVTACAWGYVRYGALPRVETVFACIAPAVCAIVAVAIWRLSRSALGGKSPAVWMIAAGALVAALMGVHELVILGCAAVLAGALPGGAGSQRSGMLPIGPGAFGLGAAASGAAGVVTATSATATAIFWVFARIGSVLFGSGYVLLAFLRAELVERRGWLTERQMLDAVAVGQFTPGPVFTTATFIGYLLDGLRGAGAATAGIFLPAFVFVAITAPFLPLLRRSRVLARALDGVNAASLALMAAVLVQLVRTSVTGWMTALLAAAALVVLLVWRVNSAWVVLVAVGVGVVAAMVRAQ